MKLSPTYTVIAALSAVVLILGGFFIYHTTSQSYMRQQLEAVERDKESQRQQQERVTEAVAGLFDGGNVTTGTAAARDAQRKSDVTLILNAVYQYAIDTGSLPSTIPTGEPRVICWKKPCEVEWPGGNLPVADLSVLHDEYLAYLPVDPQGRADAERLDAMELLYQYSGYEIIKDGSRITVSAPDAETMKIAVSR